MTYGNDGVENGVCIGNLHPLLAELPARKLICLDAEFAQGYIPGENSVMLELSVSDARGGLIYSGRFKPERIQRWRLNPHNITPRDVADAPRFRECRKEIQSIIDEADYITGFALENDFSHLESEGIVISESKKIIELRDWFWTLYGAGKGLDYVEGIGNERVAREMGLVVNEECVHSSAYDIKLSLESLNALLFRRSDKFSAATFAEFYAEVEKKFKKEKEEYDRVRAAGYCCIIKKASGYLMKTVMKKPEEHEDMVAVIEVADRKLAHMELGQMLAGKIITGPVMFRSLGEAKLERFRNYKNSFDPESAGMQSKLLKLAESLQR